MAPGHAIGAEDRFDAAGIDSMALLKVLLFVEQQFGFWVPDEDNPPFGRIQVDPILCIGCNKCTSKGPEGSFLDGCPWDAIVMIDTAEIEKEVGVMPF